jgi:hypothetical protein
MHFINDQMGVVAESLWVVCNKSHKISSSDEVDACAVRLVPHTVPHPHSDLQGEGQEVRIGRRDERLREKVLVIDINIVRDRDTSITRETAQKYNHYVMLTTTTPRCALLLLNIHTPCHPQRI